ncbi:hypothetical protein AwEntero_26460 [Enterobacterales bacterium]|nr:hypothetical protein AwEntero_26460 [Enterobacterales bacterium]
MSRSVIGKTLKWSDEIRINLAVRQENEKGSDGECDSAHKNLKTRKKAFDSKS